MRQISWLICALFFLGGFTLQMASAQLPGGVPRIPRPNTPKATPTPADTAQPTSPSGTTAPTKPQNSPASTSPAAIEPDNPTLQKDTLQINGWTKNSYKGNYDVWSWVPRLEFTVNGPIPSGSQLYAEFMQPGGNARWLKFDCDTRETKPGYWWRTECGGRAVEDQGVTTIGSVNFAIKMRNELNGTDMTLFTGKFKVAKTLSNEAGPKAANKFVYYVDHDWNLPIGYIYYTPNSTYGWDYPWLSIAFWVRGEASGRLDPHLFYQSKEIGRLFIDGTQRNRPSCRQRFENKPSHYVNEAMAKSVNWQFVECDFYVVVRWDKTNEGRGQPNTDEMFKMASNPGEYELKVLWNNKLARSIKFTVGPDGQLDNGIASANKLGTQRVLMPVQIIGDQDGAWNKGAWRTEAFYGNPLTGFTPPQ